MVPWSRDFDERLMDEDAAPLVQRICLKQRLKTFVTMSNIGEKWFAIVVHVWRPDASHVGHCALELSDGTYISWWPKSQCDAKNLRARAFANTSHSFDIEQEGDRQPNSYRIRVSDGEMNAIKRWWAGFKDKADYQIVSNNCSTVAYYAQEAAFPFLEVLNDEVPVWVPTAIEMVAVDLASGKRNFDQKRIKEIKEVARAEAKSAVGSFKGMFVKGKTTGKAGRK